jgi:hypothetical protein
MVWANANAWGSSPVNLDPLISQIQAGTVHQVILLSSQIIAPSDWIKLFQALRQAELDQHGIHTLHTSGLIVPEESHADLIQYLKVAKQLKSLAVLARTECDAGLLPFVLGFEQQLTCIGAAALENLDLSGKELSGNCPNVLRLLELNQGNLQSLNLSSNSQFKSSPYDGTWTLDRLANLELCDINLSPSEISHWIVACPNLKSLDLSGNRALGFGLDASEGDVNLENPLRHVRHLNLETIYLVQCGLTDAALFSWLVDPSRFPNLKEIGASGCEIQGVSFPMIDVPMGLHIKTLNLCGNPLVSRNFTSSVLFHFSKLESLDIAESRNFRACEFRAAMDLPELKSLCFRGNSLEDYLVSFPESDTCKTHSASQVQALDLVCARRVVLQVLLFIII